MNMGDKRQEVQKTNEKGAVNTCMLECDIKEQTVNKKNEKETEAE